MTTTSVPYTRIDDLVQMWNTEQPGCEIGTTHAEQREGEPCDQPASHRCLVLACGCVRLVCQQHAERIAAKSRTWARWECAVCNAPLGVAYGYQILRLDPL